MNASAGSTADVSCPKCPCRTAKVALKTARTIFYRCTMCQHVWSVALSENGVMVTRPPVS
jgi:DNA-directed RNA polymerase subunit M/transcription elongation factor TFIIS